VTAAREADDGRVAAGPGSSATVLADRIAAALVHHEPGWRLPRQTALARRYNVSPAEVDAAIGELSARHLIRRLPDGQLYRASPAEYLVSIEGAGGLAPLVDPMGGQLDCRSKHVSWRRVPEDIGWSLGVPPGEPACVVRLLWAAGGEPAALATAYLARHVSGPPGPETVPPAALAVLSMVARPAGEDQAGEPAAGWLPRAAFVEMQPPPPAVARSLRLSAGQPAAMLTVRFEEPGTGRPAALTVTVLRPDLFRISVEAPGGSRSGFGGIWPHALGDWES
jgi:DNA-binding GntR family transcriptional regulator